MSRKRYSRRSNETPEINITAFLNLMVVLIPFLLLSAAFSQLTVLDLYLPKIGAEDQQQQPRDNLPQLQLIIRSDRLIINDVKKGPYRIIDANDQGYDYPAMQNKLLEIKRSFPEVTQITLLSEPDIAYNRVVEVMDRLRQIRILEAGGSAYNAELFPDISVGDAPQIKSSKATDS
jgi:biopolymer transport protein ExbD